MDDENEETAALKVAKYDDFMESAEALTMKDVFLENTHELSKLEGENISLKQANEKLQTRIKELEEKVRVYKPKVVNQKMKCKQTSVKHWTQKYHVANRHIKKQADLSQQSTCKIIFGE